MPLAWSIPNACPRKRIGSPLGRHARASPSVPLRLPMARIDFIVAGPRVEANAPYSPPSWCTRRVFVEPAVPGGVPATMTM